MHTEQQMQFVEKIASLKDFNETFELVKEVVLQKYKLHRAGYLSFDYIKNDSQIN
jgi:hypothetical protein